MTIKNLSIEYDAINSENTFTNGDTINGRVVVETTKETKIQSLTFIAKGNAHVVWHEHHGQHHHRTYWADEKYYEIKHHLLRGARQDGTEVIGPGRHVFPFTFNIPDRKMPSSFKTSIGKIVHKLKAELKQSMKLTKTAKAHFAFVSKADMDFPGLMDPQYGTKDKSVKTFGSGIISLDVHTERMGYRQGERFNVTVDIVNNASRAVKPKFVLYEKTSYFAQGRRKLSTLEIVKEKAEAVESSSRKTVKQAITIPGNLLTSILNCSIIKLEYRIKVFLDIKYASDPEIKLPIVVLPADSGKKHPHPHHQHPPAVAAAGGPPPAFGFESFGEPEYPPWTNTPMQPVPHPLDPPPPYAAYPMYPNLSEKR